MARRKKRISLPTLYAIGAATLIVIAAIGLRTAAPATFVNLANLVFDSYQRAAPRVWHPDLPVRIVDIDEASLKKHGQWPWPRNLLAELTRKLHGAGAAVVAYDFVFAEADRSSPEEILKTLADTPARRALEKALEVSEPHDRQFAAALAENASVVAIFLSNSNAVSAPVKAGYAVAGDDPTPFVAEYSGAVVPLQPFSNAAKGVGAFNWLPDRDQVIRRVPLVLRTPSGFVPTLASEALRVAQGASTYVLRASNASGQTAFGAVTGLNAVRIGNFEAATDHNGAVVIRFSAFTPKRYLPAWRILENDFDPDDVGGRIVLIGTSAAGLFDLRATPINAAVPGVEVHAQVIEHIVTGSHLVRPDWAPGFEIVAAVFGSLLSALFVAVLPVRAAFPVALSFCVLFGAASWFAFTREGMQIDPVFPVGTALAALIAASSTVIFTEQRARSQIRNAFSRYLAPDLVDELAADPDRLTLGGEIRNMTLLFSDIRGFTTISEGMDAETLTRFLNDFLTPMTNVILSRRGTIDKYMGDAVMAFWNAPIDDDDHASHACSAALAMIEALAEFNAPLPINRHVAIGVGVNTGDCCVGNLGSEQRFDYSVIGDDVNIASRLEGLTKFYGVQIIAGEATVAVASPFVFVELDKVRVKGKATALTIYVLLGDDSVREQLDITALTETQEAMLAAYRRQDFARALQHLDAVGGIAKGRLDGYVAAMRYRIAVYQTTPLPDDWDGVFDPTSK